MAENPGAGAAPLTEEDEFSVVAEAVDNTREQQRKTPPQAPTEGRPAPEARGGEGGDRGGGDGRPRGPDGKFAPKPAPFEGFEALPKAQQDYILNLQRTAERSNNGYATAQRELEVLRRTRQQTPPTVQPPRPSAQQPPSQQQAPAPKKLDKWDAGKKEFPDTFDSIEERIAATEAEYGRKLTETETRLAKLEQDNQSLRDALAPIQARETVERRNHIKARLEELSPNYRRTIGWEDADGNPVPKAQQRFAPEFQGWLDWLKQDRPALHAMMQAQLKHDDPDLIGDVFQRFDRDYARAMREEEGHAGPRADTPPAPTNRANPPPRPSARAAALNDVQPRPGSGGGAPRGEPEAPSGAAYDREEAAFAAATSAQNLARWRGHRA